MGPEGEDVDSLSGEQIVPPDVMAWMEGANPRANVKDAGGDVWSVTSVKNDVTEQRDQHDVMSERDMDTPLEINVYHHLEEDVTPDAVYRAACRRQGVLAAGYVCSALRGGHRLVVRNRQLTKREAKALAIALVKNTNVSSVDLEGNLLGAEGAAYVAEMLSQNQYITRLVLSENNLGSAGAHVIYDMLHDNRTLLSLNLSGNGFEESDGKYFARVLQENTCLKELYLSHNRFRERGGELLAKGLEKNNTLEVLDLSWNHLRLKGAEAICSALQTNSCLRVLNLCYNGVSMDGCRPLGEALATNKGLQELDLSNNRIHSAALEHLLRGLTQNATLCTLKLGHNPLTAPCATTILQVLAQCVHSAVKELDLTHIPVDEAFLTEVSDLQKERAFHVTHDRIHYHNDRVWLEQTLEALRQDPLLTLSQLVRKPHARLVDVTLEQDAAGRPRDAVRQEVAHGVLTVTIPVTDPVIAKLRKRLKTIANNNPAKGARDTKKIRRRWTALADKERSSTPNPKADELSQLELLRQKLTALFDHPAQDSNPPPLPAAHPPSLPAAHPPSLPAGVRGFVVGTFEVESTSGRSSAARSTRSPGTAGDRPKFSSVSSSVGSLSGLVLDNLGDVFRSSPT